PHSPRLHLRVREHLIDPVDRTARHADRVQRRQPMSLRARTQDLADQWNDQLAMTHPSAVGRETRITRPFWPARNVAEPRELLIIAYCEDEVPAGAGRDLIRDDVLSRA